MAAALAAARALPHTYALLGCRPPPRCPPQEPTEQILRVEVFDKDMFTPQKLLTGSVTQVVNSRSLVGRTAVKLQAKVCPNAGQDFMSWLPLGNGDWASPGGPVRAAAALACCTGQGRGLCAAPRHAPKGRRRRSLHLHTDAPPHLRGRRARARASCGSR